MTKFVKVEEIIISPDRQRKAFDEGKHRELCDSIQNSAIGLMHPIVLRWTVNGMVLVAGERRLRAFKDSYELGVHTFHAGKQVPFGEVPYTDVGEMHRLDAWEAELEENIRRVDLSWQERAAATEQLKKLREEMAVERGTPMPTTKSLAEEIIGRSDGSYHTHTRDELMVAKHLNDPDVKSAPSLERAVKVIKKKEEQKRNVAMAASLGADYTSSWYSLANIDSKTWLMGPSGEYAVIITDPPYGMGADEFGDSGGKAEGAHGYEDSEENFKSIMEWLPEETFRHAAQESHLYLFCDIEQFTWLKRKFAQAGWKCFRTPLIWHKPNGFRAPWPDMGPQRRYEAILFAVKGDKTVTKMGGDVLTFQPDENLGHAAQKPVALYQELLSRSAVAGDKVLDPFCGSGPVFPAAKALKLYAYGVEKDPASYAIAAQRIKEIK